MRVYREDELIEIIKIIELGYGKRIDNEAAKTIIEGYRYAVVSRHPHYRWLLNKGDQVAIQYTKESTTMYGRVVKTHLLETVSDDIEFVCGTYDIDVSFYHSDSQVTQIIRMYNIHQVHVTLSSVAPEEHA